MSYLVLARKWRPKTFTDLIGQEHVVKALTHALNEQRLHHGYLFTGTRGVGKTTLSRILAKSLSCIEGISATPCGICDACIGIDQGRFPDYIEMDAASNRGVEEMAHILEQSVYAPVSGRFKIFMIDEVHMLTNHAFNAMLKTLEEPPEHIKFILATTDPQKIPATVLSRCLQFSLKNLSPSQISGHLSHVLEVEQIPFDAPSLRLIAQAARGSMRDALSLTDQAIAHGAGQLEESSVRNMLGVLDQTYIHRLLTALINQEGERLVSIIDEMEQRGLSFSQALSDVAVTLQQIALLQTVPNLPTEGWDGVDLLKEIATQTNVETIQLMYTIALHARAELDLAPDHTSGFTMSLIKMLAFSPIDAESPSSTPPTPIKPSTKIQLSQLPETPLENKNVPPITLQRIETPASKKTVTPSTTPHPIVSTLETATISPQTWTSDNWFQVVNQLALSGPARELGTQSEFVSLHHHVLTLRVPNLPVRIASERFKALLNERYETIHGNIQIEWQVGERQGNSLHHVQQTERQQKLDQAKQYLETDPFLQSLKKELGLVQTKGPVLIS